MEIGNSCSSDLNTVKELLLDEEKLITYVSLSKDLCIHVNYSKILLHRAVENIQNEQPNLQLNVSYIISGLADKNKSRIIVCPQEDLQTVKKSFKTIFFEHIYSVSKGEASVKDTSILLLNKFEDFILCKGFIKSSECNKYKHDEIDNLKEKQKSDSKPTVSTKVPLLNINQESRTIASTKEDKSFTIVTHNKDKSSPETKIKVEAVSKNDIATPLKQVTSNKKVINSKTQKGINAFFTKSTNNQKSYENNATDIQDKEIKRVKIEKIDNKADEMDIDEDVENHKKNEEKVKQAANIKIDSKHKNKDTENIKKERESMTKDSKKMKREAEKHDENEIKSSTNSKVKKPLKVDINRKRVLQLLDSDSEEENDPFASKQNIIEDSEDEIPPTPVTSNIKITSGLMNPKKKRRVVDKTFLDEEGYILTKKVEVYESCSDNEDNTKVTIEKICNNIVPKAEEKMKTSPIKKSVKKQSKKTISPPKGKQSTLTNFFKPK